MKLTKIQKETILNAKKENDYCTIASKKTMDSLVEKDIFKYTDGFGFKFGGIIKLTEQGKKIQKKLKNGK
jgi:hypothetical protein